MRTKKDLDAEFAALYREHGQTVFRLCMLYLGSAAKAEDAAQETFYKAYKGLHGFRRRSDAGTWLTRIAINTCKDVLRRVEPLPIAELSSEPAYTEERDTGLSLSAAVSRLSPKLREAVILHYYRGLELKEAARILGISAAAAAKRLERARTELRQLLGEDFYE